MKVLWGGSSKRDLAAIQEYIARDNPVAAEQVALAILKAIQSLSSMAERGRPTKFNKVRELVLAPMPYVVVYQVKSNEVTVVRIRHAAQSS